MKTNKDIRFPYYSGNIKLTKVLGTVDLDAFINSHKNPLDKFESLFNKIAEADKSGDGKLKRKLKHSLYSFTPNVMISKGSKRNYSNIIGWTGLMQLDFDKIDSAEEAEELRDHIFENNKEILCSYLSPSKLGVKCLLNIKMVNNKDEYINVFNAVQEKFEEYGCFDTATKNAVLPLFLSRDKNIRSRCVSKADVWSDEKIVEKKYVNLNDKPQLQTNTDNYYLNKVVFLFSERIKAINDNGHPQLRTASLILGSRCGAGYIDLLEAETLAVNCILSNEYLSKGVVGYIDTAKWAINEGMKRPKYF